METLKLTKLEEVVINKIKAGDDYDGMPTESLGNLVDSTKLDPKILRGVISSLVQKDLVQIGEFPNGIVAYHYRQE